VTSVVARQRVMVRKDTRHAVGESADIKTHEIRCCVAYICAQRVTTALDNAGGINARDPESQ
jgi:hypothetical protein